MKITQTATTVIAEAESITEALQLLKLGTVKKPLKYKRKGHDNYKGKHRKECEQCHKKYKGLKLHMYKKHGVLPLKSLTVSHES